jgi:ferric-dicitrate binding protein FerR (iron transport regulator)
MKRIEITRTAAQWLIRLEADEVQPAERASYLKWLRRSPLHVEETLRVMEVLCVLRGKASSSNPSEPFGENFAAFCAPLSCFDDGRAHGTRH